MQITLKGSEIKHMVQLLLAFVWAGLILGTYYVDHLTWFNFLRPFSRTPSGFIWLVVAPAGAIIAWEVASLIMDFQQHKQKLIAKQSQD